MSVSRRFCFLGGNYLRSGLASHTDKYLIKNPLHQYYPTVTFSRHREMLLLALWASESTWQHLNNSAVVLFSASCGRPLLHGSGFEADQLTTRYKHRSGDE